MSFSQEMKDFIGAYSKGQAINASRTNQDYHEAATTALTKKTERENDPETLELSKKKELAQLALINSRIANSAAARGATGARTQLTLEQLRQLKAAAAGGGGTGLLPPEYSGGAVSTGPTPPAPQGQGALPIGPSTLDTGEDVDAYADGGLVPDDEASEFAPDDEGMEGEAGAVPLGVPAGAPTDVSARRRDPDAVPRGLEGVIAPDLVHTATKAGMKFGIERYGLGRRTAVPTPQQQSAARMFAQGHDGLSEQEMQAARKVVDPEGKLTDSQRNMAALGSVYQYWANKGEPKRAEKVAFQMLQYYRNAAQRYAAIAAKAAEGGNVDLATKAAMKAYANVPDGNDIELLPNPDNPKQIMYAYTNEKGDVITKGIATPQQLAASAMGLATGGFDKAILAAAGAREDTGAVKPGGTGKPQSASDRAKEAEVATEAVTKMKDTWAAKEENKGKAVDEEFWQQTADTAQGLMQQNPKLNAAQAARAAHLLISPGGKDPEKPDFKVAPGEEGQPSTIKFGNGLAIKVDDNQLEQIMNSRAARVKQAVDAINTKMEEGDKPGFTEKAGKALGEMGDIVSKDVQKFGGEVRGAIPDELVARGGSAVSAVGRAISDVAAKLTDPSINFGTMTTAYKKGVIDAAKMLADKVQSKGALPVDEIGPAP